MSDTQRWLFFGIMLTALILILVGSGAWPLLWQLGTVIVNGIGGFLWGLIPKGK